MVTGTLYSGYFPSDINPNSFVFERYQSGGAKYRSSDAIYVDWVYYDGTKPTTIAREVIED